MIQFETANVDSNIVDCMIRRTHREANRHSYHVLTPVTTSFPLENSRAVHLGLSILIVIAANLRLL
jgi:hypothetical protein